MEQNNKNIKDKIASQFEQLLAKTETDPTLKKEVFSTLAKIEGAATIIDLFTSKMIKTESTILENLGNKLQDNKGNEL